MRRWETATRGLLVSQRGRWRELSWWGHVVGERRVQRAGLLTRDLRERPCVRAGVEALTSGATLSGGRACAGERASERVVLKRGADKWGRVVSDWWGTWRAGLEERRALLGCCWATREKHKEEMVWAGFGFLLFLILCFSNSNHSNYLNSNSNLNSTLAIKQK